MYRETSRCAPLSIGIRWKLTKFSIRGAQIFNPSWSCVKVSKVCDQRWNENGFLYIDIAMALVWTHKIFLHLVVLFTKITEIMYWKKNCSFSQGFPGKKCMFPRFLAYNGCFWKSFDNVVEFLIFLVSFYSLRVSRYIIFFDVFFFAITNKVQNDCVLARVV